MKHSRKTIAAATSHRNYQRRLKRTQEDREGALKGRAIPPKSTDFSGYTPEQLEEAFAHILDRTPPKGVAKFIETMTAMVPAYRQNGMEQDAMNAERFLEQAKRHLGALPSVGGVQ